MTLKNKLLTIVFIFISLTSFAGNAVIKGHAKQFIGKELELYGYSDYITNTKIKLGFTTIKKDGSFSFSMKTQHIEKIELKIEDKTTWFFVTPGAVYNINLSYDKAVNKHKIYDKILSLKFNFPAPSELNQLVMKFNQQYDKFVEDNYNDFMKRDKSVNPAIKVFKDSMLTYFKPYNSTFVNNYILYTIGDIYNDMDVSYLTYKAKRRKGETKADIYLEYLDKKPVLYYNTEYNTLFKHFFKGEFKRLTLHVKGLNITKAINEQASLQALNKALSKYPFLYNDEFRGLFILNGLLSISKDKFFKQKNILNILNQIKTTSKYKNQQLIASNIIKKITKKKLAVGVKAPPFTLKDKNGKMVSLADFKGKYVYINFWTSWSIPSLKEMEIMNVLYKKYQGAVVFISICADNDFSKMTDFLKKNPTYNWEFLHISNGTQLKEAYNVRTFPTYILIDNHQKILQAPAARPGGNAERATEDDIDRELYNLINKH